MTKPTKDRLILTMAQRQNMLRYIGDHCLKYFPDMDPPCSNWKTRSHIHWAEFLQTLPEDERAVHHLLTFTTNKRKAYGTNTTMGGMPVKKPNLLAEVARLEAEIVQLKVLDQPQTAEQTPPRAPELSKVEKRKTLTSRIVETDQWKEWSKSPHCRYPGELTIAELRETCREIGINITDIPE